MNSRPLLPVFAAALFTSAFLLFSVQPMVSKMLLPLLGGSPSVWNTAMVFFQAMLLAGYAYAHLIARFLPLKVQAAVHIALLCAFTFVLPLALPEGAMPPELGGQAGWQLGIMLSIIGGPFFVLAASAPLFQHWFASSGDKDAENPYFLYAISNTGSMVALLSYPFFIEPFLGLSLQTQAWYGGYLFLIPLVAVCAFFVRKGVNPILVQGEEDKGVTWSVRIVWAFLAFVPSSLMLGVTKFITTDLASSPLFWIIPLSLYLTTFIIAFARKPLINITLIREITAYGLCLIFLLMVLSGFTIFKWPIIAAHITIFFLCALLCHGELARAKPKASHLTEYFLIISLGGVLGGMFNALIAPIIFNSAIEYSLSLSAIGFIIWAGAKGFLLLSEPGSDPEKNTRSGRDIIRAFLFVMIAVCICLAMFFTIAVWQLVGTLILFVYLLLIVQKRGVFAFSLLTALTFYHFINWGMSRTLLTQERSYFGTIKVYEFNGNHFLQHGTTIHGVQSMTYGLHRIPLSYYNPLSPIANIFNEISKRGPRQNIAAIGLGIGTIACYPTPGRSFDFFEIDSDIVRIAHDKRYFTYLSECGSPYNIIYGDGRIKIAQQNKTYDMILIDAFSSDYIPTHLMTKEAFEVYFSKLSADGIVAINISNRYYNLRPVLDAITKELGVAVYFKYDAPEQNQNDISRLYAGSQYAVLAKDPKTLELFDSEYGWTTNTLKKNPVRAWTDDYANPVSSFIFLP